MACSLVYQPLPGRFNELEPLKGSNCSPGCLTELQAQQRPKRSLGHLKEIEALERPNRLHGHLNELEALERPNRLPGHLNELEALERPNHSPGHLNEVEALERPNRSPGHLNELEALVNTFKTKIILKTFKHSRVLSYLFWVLNGGRCKTQTILKLLKLLQINNKLLTQYIVRALFKEVHNFQSIDQQFIIFMETKWDIAYANANQIS